MKYESILRLLQIMSDNDCYDDMTWGTRGDAAPIKFYINCNDLFWWGTADGEEVSEEDLDLLEKTFEDAKQADEYGNCYATLLFCSRKRQMRPQNAYYDHFPESLHPLFDASGPEREVDFLNPKKRKV